MTQATRTPLRLIRHGRFLSPAARLQYRIYRLRTGNVFAAGGPGGFRMVVLVYAVRVGTLPFAIRGDWCAVPLLRAIDRSPTSWWVVEVRFHGRDAEFVRVAEEPSEQAARDRLSAINGQ